MIYYKVYSSESCQGSEFWELAEAFAHMRELVDDGHDPVCVAHVHDRTRRLTYADIAECQS